MPATQSSDEFTGLFVAAVFFGFFLQSSFQCVRAFWRQKQKQGVMYFVAIVLYALVVTDISLAVVRHLNVLQCCPQDGGNCSHSTIPWYDLVKISIVALSSLLVEGVLIYRCWFVYLRRWAAVVIPILCWFSGLAMITYTICVEAKPERQKSYPQWKAGDIVHTAFWGLTILMNVMTTTLIVWRILQVDSKITGRHSWIKPVYNPQTPLQNVVQTVVMSGFMCTPASLFIFVSRISDSRSSVLASSMMILVSAISFNLIIVRVERNARKMNKGFAQAAQISSLFFEKNKFTPIPRTKSQIYSTFGKESASTSDPLILPQCPVARLNRERHPYCELELRIESGGLSCLITGHFLTYSYV